jgi:hypothetical protein
MPSLTPGVGFRASVASEKVASKKAVDVDDQSRILMSCLGFFVQTFTIKHLEKGDCEHLRTGC